ncbi:hypothetical protein PSHT_11110 [Puccinia striiformis]|uniref:Uncharacterized protein n=1 Tax=Puccinia striiformis TaxID=27350 RepID=A0A2S4V5N7_9BASI|nr:hypothetical protein PSHT_11110 [Puccinia striiformis]
MVWAIIERKILDLRKIPTAALSDFHGAETLTTRYLQAFVREIKTEVMILRQPFGEDIQQPEFERFAHMEKILQETDPARIYTLKVELVLIGRFLEGISAHMLTSPHCTSAVDSISVEERKTFSNSLACLALCSAEHNAWKLSINGSGRATLPESFKHCNATIPEEILSFLGEDGCVDYRNFGDGANPDKFVRIHWEIIQHETLISFKKLSSIKLVGINMGEHFLKSFQDSPGLRKVQIDSPNIRVQTLFELLRKWPLLRKINCRVRGGQGSLDLILYCFTHKIVLDECFYPAVS